MLVNRRELLYGMAVACAAMSEFAAFQGRQNGLRINAARLQRRREDLSVNGRPAGGTFADGVSRVAYSDADVGGRKYAMAAMGEAGLKPRIDPAGNIFGARAGSDASLLRILFGSHIDSRSEEHTSELQSLTNLVCRLLLEKKKKHRKI